MEILEYLLKNGYCCNITNKEYLTRTYEFYSQENPFNVLWREELYVGEDIKGALVFRASGEDEDTNDYFEGTAPIGETSLKDLGNFLGTITDYIQYVRGKEIDRLLDEKD